MGQCAGFGVFTVGQGLFWNLKQFVVAARELEFSLGGQIQVLEQVCGDQGDA